MALLIYCEKCNRKMGSLEPFVILGYNYCCLSCSGKQTNPQKSQAKHEPAMTIDEVMAICKHKTAGNTRLYAVLIKKGYKYKGIYSFNELENGLPSSGNGRLDVFEEAKSYITIDNMVGGIFREKVNTNNIPSDKRGISQFLTVNIGETLEENKIPEAKW